MTIVGFMGPTGTGKNLSETAMSIDTKIREENLGNTYKIYANYKMYNGDNYPQRNRIPDPETGTFHEGTPLPGWEPMLNLQEQIPNLHDCQLNLMEFQNIADARNQGEKNVFITNLIANVRKQDVHFLHDTKDPESECDKRIRGNTTYWIAPFWFEQADLLIWAYYLRLKKYYEALDKDKVLESADQLIPIPNASRFFAYYDTREPTDAYRQPFPLRRYSEEYQEWLDRHSLKPSPGSLAVWLELSNYASPNGNAKTAIIYWASNNLSRVIPLPKPLLPPYPSTP